MDYIEAAVEYWKTKNLDSYDFVLLMITENSILSAIFTSKLNNRKGIIINGEEAQRLLKLYSLYEFSDKVIIDSLVQPFGRKLRNLMDCGIATNEELINEVILGVM